MLPTSEIAQEYIPWVVGYYAYASWVPRTCLYSELTSRRSGEKTVLQYLQMTVPDSLVALTSTGMALLLVAAGFRTPNVVPRACPGHLAILRLLD